MGNTLSATDSEGKNATYTTIISPSLKRYRNPNVKTISIGTPSKEEREALIKGENFVSFFAADIYDGDYPYYEQHPEELEKVQDKFVGLTDGFSFTEINGLRRLCKNERTHIRQMSSVIDLYS